MADLLQKNTKWSNKIDKNVLFMVGCFLLSCLLRRDILGSIAHNKTSIYVTDNQFLLLKMSSWPVLVISQYIHDPFPLPYNMFMTFYLSMYSWPVSFTSVCSWPLFFFYLTVMFSLPLKTYSLHIVSIYTESVLLSVLWCVHDFSLYMPHKLYSYLSICFLTMCSWSLKGISRSLFYQEI